jgi:putative transposase
MGRMGFWVHSLAYCAYFNDARPHQGIGQQLPSRPLASPKGVVVEIPVLNGPHHDYRRAA